MSLTDSEVQKAYFTSLSSPDAKERAEAGALLGRHYVDEGAVRKMVEVLPPGVAAGQGWLSQIEKARVNQTALGIKSKSRPGMRDSFDGDPLDLNTAIPGTRSKRWRAPDEILRTVAESNPLIIAVLAHFTNRTLSHARPIEPGINAILNQPRGFDIVRRGQPVYQELSEDDEREKQHIVDFIANSGDLPRFDPEGGPTREDFGRDPFRNFLSKIVFDRFVLDAIAIELTKTRNRKRLSGIYVADGGRIYKTAHRDWPYGYARDIEDEKARFVEVYQNKVVNTFRADELYYSYSNARSGMRYNGYGISEVEMTLRLTTGILNVIANANSMFDRNALPEGFLVLQGFVNDEALVSLSEQYQAYRMDPGGSFGLPVIAFRDQGAKADFLRIGKGPEDMEMQVYTNFNYATTSAVFGIDVVELNGSSFGGQNGGLNSGKDTKARLEESRDRGWYPWMGTAAEIINDIYSPILGEKWRFVWRGIDRADSDRMWELYQKVHGNDEARVGLFASEPVGGVVGNSLIDNPSISQMTAAIVKDGGNPGGKMGEALEGLNVGGLKAQQPPGGAPAKKGETKKAIAKALLALLEDGDLDD